MAWIDIIDHEKASGNLKKKLTIHSLHPKTLEAHLFKYEELMYGENNLSKQQHEMIGVVVSAANSCEY